MSKWSRLLVIVTGLVLVGSAPAAAAPYRVPVDPPGDAPPMKTWQGTWQRLPKAPMAGRTDAVMVAPVFSDRVIVWGGRDTHGKLLNDGAIYNVRLGRWRDIGAAPIGPRERFGYDSDNEGIVIWGGLDPQGRKLADGAIWSWRERGSGYGWQVLPDAPLPAGVAAIGGDLNGEYVISEDAHGRPVMAVLDDGTWQSIDVPLPGGVRYQIVSPVYDTALVISYQADGFAVAARYHDSPGRWDGLLRLPLTDAATGSVARWQAGWFSRTDQALPGTQVTGRYGVVADLDAIKHPWQATDTVPAGVLRDRSLTWSPRYLISPETLTAFDPVTGGWLRLPALPGGRREGAAAAWTRGSLYLFGGHRADGSLDQGGWVFTPTLPPNTYDLPGDFADGYGDCGGVGNQATWHLRGDPQDPMLVWLQHGAERIPTFWPDGVTVRFGATMKILHPNGSVIARAGDVFSDGRDDDLHPCFNGTSAYFVGVTAP